MQKWSDVQPTMMSDEEEIDGKFKVHRQEWRSVEFNTFMDDLDARAIANQGKTRPRFLRYFGTPCKSEPPANANSWMMSSQPNSSEDEEILAPTSPEMFCD